MSNETKKDYAMVTFTPSTEVLIQELDGEAVLLNLDNEHYYGLNELGLRVWQLMEDHNSLEPIISTLLDEYDVTKDDLERDLNELLQDMQKGGLIQIEE